MRAGRTVFARLSRFQQAGAFFVTRAKANLQFTRRYSHLIDQATGVRCDQTHRPCRFLTPSAIPSRVGLSRQ
ncbi:MAG: hypothetical protein HY766_10455 [candidate division NC10 bacterium]|nr:hypothetical protein [candidate division NC10 bacterium]MBI4840183.1 hypothetical protein [candidate division NC10 bacterium]